MKDGHLLHTPRQPDYYTGPTHPEHIQMMGMKPSYVDTVAVHVSDQKTGKGSVRLSVLNRSPTAAWEANIKFEGFGMWGSPQELWSRS